LANHLRFLLNYLGGLVRSYMKWGLFAAVSLFKQWVTVWSETVTYLQYNQRIYKYNFYYSVQNYMCRLY